MHPPKTDERETHLDDGGPKAARGEATRGQREHQRLQGVGQAGRAAAALGPVEFGLSMRMCDEWASDGRAKGPSIAPDRTDTHPASPGWSWPTSRDKAWRMP